METMLFISTITFGGVIILLTTLVILAQKKLTRQGKVTITINEDEDKRLDVEPSGTLLSALASNKIFIPSACGGGGTCGMCKVQVREGGGGVLPTETGHLTRSEVKDDVRLSCQVKVRDNMKIEVPEELFSIRNFDVTVKSNKNCATFIKEFIMELDPGDELDFKAGGYVQIEIPPYQIDFKDFDIEEEYRGDWDKYNLWDLKGRNEETVIRAYSMANHPAENNIVMLTVRIATPPPGVDCLPGLASTYIFNLKPGDRCRISGPYGEFFINESEREMCYIGGGAGMAPMRSHIFHLFHTLKTKRKVSFWYGARSKREMFYDDEFKAIAEKEENDFNYNVALSDPNPEDNWEGYTGFIHQVVHDKYLKDHEDPTEIEYYLCGPPMMIDAVINMLDELGVDEDMIRYDKF